MTQLAKTPSVDVGVLIRRPPHDVFEALADPSITTTFWYTKSSGRMEEGAELTWEWEMYKASGNVWVHEVEPDLFVDTVQEGDIFLLCSDGLWGSVPDEKIAAIIRSTTDIEAACQLLIDAANEAGGPDNISAVLVRAG